MFCANCGNKVVDGDVFCTSCGKKIVAQNVATQHTEEKTPTYINSGHVARPGLLIAAEVLGYVIGGLFVLGALCSIADDFIGSVFIFLIGGGLVALPLFMHRGARWARIVYTVCWGILVLLAFTADASGDEVLWACIVFVASVCAIVFSWVPSANRWFNLAENRW